MYARPIVLAPANATTQNFPMNQLDQLFAEIRAADKSSAPRKQWQTVEQGEIDIRIMADGSWYHQGRAFQRPALVNLFASVLRRENDDYFLVTPAEKLRIQVDDAPFCANLVERIESSGQSAVVFTTNVGERFAVDDGHRVRIAYKESGGEPRPYLALRDGLEALIGRSAFFDLVNFAEETEHAGKICLCFTSLGQTFELGNGSE